MCCHDCVRASWCTSTTFSGLLSIRRSGSPTGGLGTKSYVLKAFLQFNDSFEILFFNSYLDGSLPAGPRDAHSGWLLQNPEESLDPKDAVERVITLIDTVIDDPRMTTNPRAVHSIAIKS